MRKLFALIGIIGLVGMTAFSLVNFWVTGDQSSGPSVQEQQLKEAQEKTMSEIIPEEGTETTESETASSLSEKMEEAVEITEEEPTEVGQAEKEIEVKDAAYLSGVPFAPQAPFGTWDDLHNEACEEAAIALAYYWLREKEMTPHLMDQEILKMVAWQEENWDGHYDLDVQHLLAMAQTIYHLDNLSLLYNPNKEDLMQELSQGHLLIVPTAGRLLNNPYYRDPGPSYHMLVARGYNEKEIITNDTGTKRGENFAYPWSNFLISIHDWPFSFGRHIDKDQAAREMVKGRSVVIVVRK